MASSRRKSAAIALAVVGVAGLSIASAAQLNVDNSSLGAGNSIVTSCQPADTPITVGFTSTFASGEYETAAVNLGNIDEACGGQALNLTVVDDSGAALATATEITLPGTPAASTVVAIGPTAASAIAGVSVVISG